MSATPGFMKLLQNSNHQNEMNRKLKNTVKNRLDCVGIFTCACACVCVGGIVVYYCVCMCKWYIAHVYVKVHAQRVVLTGC